MDSIKNIFTGLLLMALSLPVISVSAQQTTKLHRRCGTSMLMEKARATGDTRAISAGYNYVPHSATVTIPVILVNFNDVKLTVNNPREAFDQFFNGTTQTELGNGNAQNHGSVTQYFSDMSGGSFTPVFKVYDPVTVGRNETYYGGTNEDDNGDERTRELVRDAVDSLMATGTVSDADIEAFSRGTGTIDCVNIIYAGMGQNNGGAGTTVWANTWQPFSSTSMGGKTIRWYSMAGELNPGKVDSEGNISSTGTNSLIAGVGVTCHELSHALGLPDFYPTNGSAQIDNQEMEYWDLMDGGEYSGEGFYPTAYTAFEKNEMGWTVDIQELTEDKTVTMTTSTEKGGTAYKIVNPLNSNEYLMLECIQRRGWNRQQYGNGLLVYHVNRTSEDINSNSMLNNTPGYPGMAVVPADGACLSSYIDANKPLYGRSLRGDLFPGTGNLTPDTLDVTELSDDKPQPNFCWYNSGMTRKLATGKALRNIAYDTTTGIVTFNYIHDTTTGIDNVKPAVTAKSQKVYSIDGRYLGNDLNSLPKGIYVVDGKKMVK